MTTSLQPLVENRLVANDSASSRNAPEPAASRPLLVGCATGTRGDVSPVVAVCAELQRRGWDVVFLTNQKFEALVCGAGLRFVSIGPSEEFERGTVPDAWDRKSKSALNPLVLEYNLPGAARAAAWLMDCHQRTPVTAVVGLEEPSGASVAARKLGVPVVELDLTVVGTWAVTPETVLIQEQHLLRKRWGRARIALKRRYVRLVGRLLDGSVGRSIGDVLGLSSSVQAWSSHRRLPLLMVPDWFLAAGGTTKTRATPVGFPLYDSVSATGRQEVDRFIATHGRPVVFTPGSGVSDVRKFLGIALEVSRVLGVPCVLLTPHWRQVEHEMPSNALGCDYVDLAHLLPQSLALVHQGGVGTCAQAIRAGIPQLVRPQQFDQFENGYRLWRLGLGAYIFEESFTSETCAQLLGKMLEKAPRMKSLRRHSELLKASESAPLAADLIERFIAEGAAEGASGRRAFDAAPQVRGEPTESEEMSKGCRFSVVVLVKPSSRGLSRALQSAMAQEFHGFEILVVGDDLSREQSAEVELCVARAQSADAASGTCVRVLTCGRDQAMRAARGSWLAVLDADDEWTPDLLRQHWSRIQAAESELGMTWARGWAVDRNAAGVAVGCRAVVYRDSLFGRDAPIGVCLRREWVLGSSKARAALALGDYRALTRICRSLGYTTLAGENLGVLSQRYAQRRAWLIGLRWSSLR